MSIKIIIGLLILKAVFLLSIIAIVFFMKDTDPAERTFMNGVRTAIIEKYKLDMSDPSFAIGILVGSLMFTGLFTALNLLFVYSRKFWPLIIFVALDILFGFGSHGVPIIPIIILGLTQFTSARNYFRKTKPELSVLDEHMSDKWNKAP